LGETNKMEATEKDFPEEIIQPIKALTDEKRRKILSLLLENNFSYSQLRTQINKYFDVNKGTFNHHLHILVGSGLIRNFNINDPESKYNSFYAITNFGQRFLEGLRQTLEPEVEKLYDFDIFGANSGYATVDSASGLSKIKTKMITVQYVKR
jgi:DNA-binding transcriptional ArsR family regulator